MQTKLFLLTFLSVIIFYHIDSVAQNATILDTIPKVTQVELNSEQFFIEDNYKGKKYLFKDGWLYFVENASSYISGVSIYKIRSDGTDKQKIFTSEDSFNLQDVEKGWIYLTGEIDDNNNQRVVIYRIKIGTTKLIKLNNIDSKNVFVYKDKIYYTVSEKDKFHTDIIKSIYKMGIDGSDNHKLNDKEYYSFYISDDIIYAKTFSGKTLEKMDLDGNLIDATNISVDQFTVSGSKIYYDDYGTIGVINTDGTGRKTIDNNERKTNLFLLNGKIYWSSERWNVKLKGFVFGPVGASYGYLYSLDIENGEMKVLYDDTPVRMDGVCNGIIYFRKFDEKQEQVFNYKMKADGTNIKRRGF